MRLSTRIPLPTPAARLVRRLSVWCAFALVFVVPRLSHAAAPFCDPSGMSMVAPVPALPTQTGELRAPASSCDDLSRDFAAASRTRHDAPPAERVLTPTDRVLPSHLSFPEIKGTTLPAPTRAEEVVLPGHPRTVYRPPRG
jgi:hypothetical protein